LSAVILVVCPARVVLCEAVVVVREFISLVCLARVVVWDAVVAVKELILLVLSPIESVLEFIALSSAVISAVCPSEVPLRRSIELELLVMRVERSLSGSAYELLDSAFSVAERQR
jgi:hypothetical protein